MRKRSVAAGADSMVAAIFYRGNHADVVAMTFDAGQAVDFGRDTAFVVGALAFLGRLDEATHLFALNAADLAPADAIAARFFLAVAACRHSRYDQARRLIAENLVASRREGSLRSRFFAAQGIGFYRLFGGRYHDAARHARAALLAAIGADFSYGIFLALDLSGHTLVQVGRVAEGLANLGEALALAKLFGDGGMAEATTIGIACYEAQFGLAGDGVIARLQTLYAQLAPQNTYSRGTLLLELGRQSSLRGDVAASRSYLDAACRIIHAQHHRRQSTVLNHRHAYNLYLGGEHGRALHLLRLAKGDIDPVIDRGLDLQLSGLELRLCVVLGLTAEAETLARQVHALTVKTGSYIGRRTWARTEGHLSAWPLGQDPLGDLLDASGSASGQKALLDAGYYTPLRLGWGLAEMQRAVIASPLLGQIVVVDPPSVRATGVTPSRQITTLLLRLHAGDCSKEALVREVWGYRYHPGRHDALIYQAMSRLRDALGPLGHLLEATGTGYRLSSGIAVVAPGPATARPPALSDAAEETADLGPRGPLVLEYLAENRAVDRKTCMRLFDVSAVTASRDLALLVRKKVLKQVGWGRSARYARR